MELGSSSNSSVEVIWTQKNEAASFVQIYTVHFRAKPTSATDTVVNYWKNISLPVHDFTAERLDGLSGKFEAQNLFCGREYEFYVTSQNAVGESRPGNVMTAKTAGER